jgi:hypothetical protein
MISCADQSKNACGTLRAAAGCRSRSLPYREMAQPGTTTSHHLQIEILASTCGAGGGTADILLDEHGTKAPV